MAERWNPLRRFLFFACGAFLGGLLGATTLGRFAPTRTGPMYAALLGIVAIALVVGWISATFGDRFWNAWASGWWWWWS